MQEKMHLLHQCELEILDELVRICTIHNLRYYLAGGTLLGAIRHKGFIPWDDDIDVEMPREDYELFAKYCSDELDEKFFYQSPETDRHYFLTYAKLRINGTFFPEERFEKSNFHKGIFIDIFPLDYSISPSPVSRFVFNLMAVTNRRGQADSGETVEPYKKTSGKLCYFLLSFFSTKQMLCVRQFLIKCSAKLSRKDYYASFSGAYGYPKEVFPVKWYDFTEQVEFEGKKYLVSFQADLILKQIYGSDYMALPPDDKRVTHCDISKALFNTKKDGSNGNVDKG